LIASDGQYQSIAGYEEWGIGRAIDNHLVLEDSAVSRKHANLVKTPKGYVIKDLNSSNGTFVNAISVKEALVKSGDVIQIGKFIFELREGTEEEIQAYLKKRQEKTREDVPTTILGKFHFLREEKISGELEEFSIVPIVQTLISEKKTGIFRITFENEFIGALYFMNGAIIDAECPPAPDGNLAVFEILKHKKGRFAFDASMVPRPPVIEEDSMQLLLEGCRRMDEVSEEAD
jgi:hypothetical protein